jgi:hypothetical protein
MKMTVSVDFSESFDLCELPGSVTVADLIAALQRMPPDLPVIIEGYEAGLDASELESRSYEAVEVEGLITGDGVRSVVVYARKTHPKAG